MRAHRHAPRGKARATADRRVAEPVGGSGCLHGCPSRARGALHAATCMMPRARGDDQHEARARAKGRGAHATFITNAHTRRAVVRTAAYSTSCARGCTHNKRAEP
jgi:hypothetical protein